MKLGLCLAGGGAKGAFEGGIIKRLYENNLIPSVVAGTSIGAINAYFLMTGNANKLEEMWNLPRKTIKGAKLDKVIDNSSLIEELKKLSGREDRIESVYVNYVHVEAGNLSEVIIDITRCEKSRALESIKYSSLLPEPPNNKEDGFDSSKLFEHFREAVKNGVYEGYNLDGGILNNNLLTPFINDRVDCILIVGLKDGYCPPDYIYDHYDRGKVYVISPDIRIMPMDTMRFEKDFCSGLFERGYRLSENIVNHLKICI